MKKISIIMGIYNCQDTLAEAIQSIFDQDYPRWELILCDDGSGDQTYALAEGFRQKDPERVKLLRNEKNLGLNATLNRCLKEATGDYIARMDGDDLSTPERFSKEVQALEEHPEFAFVSAAMTLFDEQGVWGQTKPVPVPDERDLMRGSPFAHAPCMVRREAFERVGGYSVSNKLLRVEDYHLWYKMFKAGLRGMNLLEPLYRCRDGRDAQNRRKFRYRLNESHVKGLIFRDLRLPLSYWPLILRPVLTGLLPSGLYRRLHRGRLRPPENEGGK